MSMEEKNKYIESIIYSKAKETNEKYNGLITVEQYRKAIDMYHNSDKSIEVIESEIDQYVEDIKKIYKEKLEQRIEIENNNALNLLNLGTDKIGAYLSQQQIDLLSIVEIKSKKDLTDYFNNYCFQFPNKDIEEILPNFKSSSEGEIELYKRKLFDEYKKTFTDYIEFSKLNINEIVELKLSKMGINNESIQYIIENFINVRNFDKAYEYLDELYGNDFVKQFNRLINDDFENVKSVTYEQIVELANVIRNKNSLDTIVATGKYIDTHFYNGKTIEFDPIYTKKALDYCIKNNKHMRYHVLFDYGHVEDLVKKYPNFHQESYEKQIEIKKQIISEMTEFVKQSMEFIRENNVQMRDSSGNLLYNVDGTPKMVINVIEVFNELVERNKSEIEKSQPYQMKWEKEFGITINDLMGCFKSIEKPIGVKYMYNETTMTESKFKRDKIKEVMDQIYQYGINNNYGNFIDIFADQSHLSEKDLQNDGISLKETADVLKFFQDQYNLKIEISEHDYHFSKEYLTKLINFGFKSKDISKIKISDQKKVSEIYRNSGVDFDRVGYWTLFDKNDHNLVRTNIDLSNSNQIIMSNLYSGIFNDSIKITPNLEECFKDIVQISLLSSREALDKYSSDPKFAIHKQQAEEQSKVLLKQLQQLRQSNSNMTDAVFYQNAMASFLTPVIQKISMEYGQIIPQEKLQRLQGLMNPQNITFTNEPNQNDIQADSDKGTIVINPQKTNGSTLEEKIVSSMSVSIHESFHLIVNMLKSPEQAEALGERLMYTVATRDGDKEVHFAPGKYGQVLSEGFVEKLSSEFAQKNGFFYTLNPSYVPYVNLCTQLMKQDKSIDMPTLFTTNGDKIVDKMSPEVKTKFESAERLAVINNFSVKEAKKDPVLKGITSENVKSSWMEVNDKKVSVSENTTYRKPLESTEKKQEEHSETKAIESKTSISKGPEVKSFSWKSNSEAMVYSQIKQKNQMIKQQKAQQKQMNKPKVKTLTPSSQGGTGSKGFTNVVLLSLIVSFVSGALFMVMYMLLGGK